jgi:titin
VRGLVIGGFSGSGIVIESQGGDTVAGDEIGIEDFVSGSLPFANTRFGVDVTAPNNTIGGTSLDARNLISANIGAGIGLEPGSSSNTVAGNYIGTDAAGLMGLGNGLGVEVQDSQGNIIGGRGVASNLISGNGGQGVLITGQGATQNDVTGNDIGTDANGAPMLWNAVGAMISNAPANTIGGPGPGAGNTVSGGDGDGIDIVGPGSIDNLVEGNTVGTGVSGLAHQGRAMNGICIINAPNNQVGGVTTAAGNVILGFARSGMVITGSHATGNVVEGNVIGTDRHGASTGGNGLNGVTISHGASNNVIGGTSPAAANVIAFNGTSGTGSGVAVTSGVGNVILSNLIYGNTGEPIALSSTSSPTIPAAKAPVVRSAILDKGRLRIDGTVDANPGSRVLIQFFLSDPAQPRTAPKLLGNVIVQANPRGQRHFDVVFREIGSLGRLVTATATISGNGTSTYSKGVSVVRS